MKSVNQFNLKLGKTGSFSKPKTANVKDHSEVAIDLVTVLDITIEKKHMHTILKSFFSFSYTIVQLYIPSSSTPFFALQKTKMIIS